MKSQRVSAAFKMFYFKVDEIRLELRVAKSDQEKTVTRHPLDGLLREQG
jgi:hypothetical protein